ncbi:putative glycosyltransferase [Rhodopirellula baltica SH 1]|uniref:Glycosyltransferase n=3 Tax=Rhodopirellula baltica TaxID=265606 RepID=Q7UVR4_RHOBA|nr:putative glycosyltransferase [Rhodopirellula baltica SH 1]
MPDAAKPNWICAQQGAREHYAIPRALAGRNELALLLTDIWNKDSSFLGRMPGAIARRLRSRSHEDLREYAVRSFPFTFARIEAMQRVRREESSSYYAARNERFDRLCKNGLQDFLSIDSNGDCLTVFAFAHACRDLFEFARRVGCQTVLGQFDPGPAEADIVEQEHFDRPEFRTTWKRYPESYVERWREEIEHANRVVVNSTWSRNCLIGRGIDPSRIEVLPLAEVPSAAPEFRRNFPDRFTRERPLRALFLGQIILRKGVARLIDAARELVDEPIEFHLVGPTDIENLSELIDGLPITWHGSAARSQVSQHYRDADVFLLPTLSDGFALTQLEAQAWRLPVVATHRCGSVVEPNVNGLLLDEPTGPAIAAAIASLLESPERLVAMSSATCIPRGGLDLLADGLLRTESKLRKVT